MNDKNFYRKIHRKNFTEKIDNNQKYSSRIRSLNNRVLNSNLTTLENDTSDCNSLNKINYSTYHEHMSSNIKDQRHNRSNIIPNPKYTYTLSTNGNNDDDRNYISHKNSKKINFIKFLINNAKKNINSEPGKIPNYERKYLESFELYKTDNEKRAFSNKLKKHRDNLNNIVKVLNEANNRNKKNDLLNDENNKYDLKENNTSKNNLNYSNERIKNKKKIESQKCLTGAEKKNKYIRIRDKFDTYTYNHKNNNVQKNNKIKSHKEIMDINLNNNNINKNLNNRLLINEKLNHKNYTSDNITNGKNNNYCNNELLYKIPTESSSNNNLNDNIIINNIMQNKEEENKKIDILRSEYKTISNNYRQISKQIDSLKNGELTYEDIIKNNSKTKDLLNYNYKNNNDLENEKIFILMKLKLKNYEIITNKLEDENKIYKKKYRKMNNILKKNNMLTEENNSLKDELNDMNINYQKLNEDLQEYENKISNINSFNKKIQEINRGLMNENCDYKRNYEISKKEYKELKINYDKIIPQQTELIKKLEEEKNEMIQKLEENNNYINEEKSNMKILLDNSQSKYKILEQNYNELKNKYIKIEENLNNNNNKKDELQILNTNLIEDNKILTEKNNELIKEKDKLENKINEEENKYNILISEYNKFINQNEVNSKQRDNNYNNLLTKYNNISTKYNTINIENEGLKNELIKQKEIFAIIENNYNKLKNKENGKYLDNKNNNENKQLNDIIKQKDEIINTLKQKCDNYEKKILEFQDMDKNIDEMKNNDIKINEENNTIEKNELIKLNNELKNDNILKDKEILNLKTKIEQLKNETSNNKNNTIEDNNNGIENDTNNINNKNILFNQLFSKFALKDVKQNKIRMLIGMHLLKQKIKYDKQIQMYNEKNEKLAKANKKLNDKIVEYKLNNINNDYSDSIRSNNNEESFKNKGSFEQENNNIYKINNKNQ